MRRPEAGRCLVHSREGQVSGAAGARWEKETTTSSWAGARLQGPCGSGEESGEPGRGVSRAVGDEAGLTDALLASKGHLSAILAIKGNLSSSDVRSIRSILDVSMGMHQSSKPLFSLIKVG